MTLAFFVLVSFLLNLIPVANATANLSPSGSDCAYMYVSMDPSASANEFTMEGMFTPSDISGTVPFLATSSGAIQLSYSSGNWNVYVSGAGTTSYTEAIVALDKVQVAFTMDASEFAFMLNGVEVIRQAHSLSMPLGAEHYMVGTMGGYCFDGNIEEVRFWETALDEDSIACLMNHHLGSSIPPDLFARYSLQSDSTDDLGVYDMSESSSPAPSYDGAMDLDEIDAATLDPTCYDHDEDGYSTDDGDCDETDAAINPDAEEIFDDGIDQDCDGVDSTTPVDTGDTGSDDTGSDDTGSDDTGSDDTGSDDTGSDDTGSDDTGSDDTGFVRDTAHPQQLDDTGWGAVKYGSGCACNSASVSPVWMWGFVLAMMIRRRE